MKSITKLFFLLFLLASCGRKEATYRIYGEMSDNSCNNSLIFLVPAEGAQTAETVDSTYIENGKFYFEGEEEKMAILRLSHLYRIDHQELLIVTEPGAIKVKIGKVSTVTGTPQNNLLQSWKEKKEKGEETLLNCRKRWLERRGSNDSITYEHVTDSIRNRLNEDTWALLKESGNNSLGSFFYIRFKHLFTEEIREELTTIFE